MSFRNCLFFLATVLVSSIACGQPHSSWTQLSLSTCRVDDFLADHPTSDGRGVVIAVLDTGVDPSIPGLTRTPDGEVKVIDVQDFTGQGDIELHRVHTDASKEHLIHHDENGSPIQYALPALPDSQGEERRFWFGFFSESTFVNSSVADLNDNGDTDDEFPLMVTALSGDGDDQAVLYVDTDLDRDFSDEKPLKNYKLQFDTFTFHREKPEAQIIPVTFAANIFLRQSKVVIHYDDGAHGTHVAGIAAGYRINNQDGFNGVAPGAKIISLKIGQNAIGSVSTTESIKSALEYAARFARERNVQVVCNLSFGVESEIEGDSDIDKFVDELMRKNPHMIFCSSAGNAGPGLSSVGTPAAAAETISVAAMLAADSGGDVMGYTMDRPVVTVFSSRGGESGKPDIATPGWSTSTVPRWVRDGDYWAGTSMASPYVAGLCALLISDAHSRDAGAKVRACDVRRALRLTALPVANETRLGAGAGCPNLPAAAEMLEKLIARAADDPVIGYEITTPCPHGSGGEASAAYWRSTYHPTDERQVFTVTPVFAPGTDASAKTSFVRKFTLRSNVPWCRLPQKEIYLRGEQSARVYVEYDAAALSDPGLYVGTIEAVHDGLAAFELGNTIVVPHRGHAEDDFALRFMDQTVNGWTPNRFFLAIPSGASAMKLTLSAPAGKESKASFERIYDPNGSRHRIRANKLDTPAGRREVVWTIAEDLVPGVWEVPVVADRPDKTWPFDLQVRFIGLHADPTTVREWSDSPPVGHLVVTNLFDRRLSAQGHGKLEGFRKLAEENFTGLTDTITHSLTLDEQFDRVRVDLEMTPEAYATTTDIGVRIEVGGEEIYSSAFSNRRHRATVRVPVSGESTDVKLIIQGGFAVADDKRETPIVVRFDQLLAEPISASVKHGESTRIDFVPGVPLRLNFELDTAPPATPDGLHPVGYLEFKERHSGDVALRVPIEI